MELIKRVSENSQDIVGVVGEVIANTPNATVIGNYTATVAVDQAPNERFRAFPNKRGLPWHQHNLPVVLFSGAVLGKEAGPVFRVQRNLDAVVCAALNRSVLPGHDLIDRFNATFDDGRVFGIEDDPKPPHTIHS